MKKLTLFLVFSACMLFTRANDSTSSTTDTSKVTASKVYSDVKSALVSLGSALKVGSEHVYQILVKQSIVEAVIYLCIGILGFILAGISWKGATLAIKTSEDPFIARAIGFGIGSIILFLVFVFHIDTIMTGFINPEFGALERIINVVR